MFPSTHLYPKIAVTTIKIKSPKSDIKVHKYSLKDSPKISQELTIRGNSSVTHNDDKITQAWNRLKIETLSKAIAIAPNIGPCSIGPNSVLASEQEPPDIDKLDLGIAVTSTPVKPKTGDVKIKKRVTFETADKSKIDLFDVSEIPPVKESKTDEMKELEALRILCLDKFEAKVQRCLQKKKDDYLKVWKEHDERTKEKLEAHKLELEKERIVKIQEQNIAAQKFIKESKANVQETEQSLQESQSDHEKRIAETGEKIRQIEQKRKELEEKQKRKRDELKKCINGIYEMQVAYGQKYNEINETTKRCKDTRMLNEKVMGELGKLKRMNELVIKLVEKSKDGKVTLNDLKTAEALVQQIAITSQIFTKHTDEINASLEKASEDKKREQHERELKDKQEEIEKQQKAKVKIESAKIKKEQHTIKLSVGVEDCISAESLRWHLELSKYLEDFERNLQPLLNDDSLKKFRFDCQKVVNVPVNAISPLDDLHLQDKLYKLSRLLQGQAVPLGNTLFLATGHPLGVPFCTNLLAKKLVKQGEHVVSSKPEAAFAIAAVIVALWVDFPDFGRLLLAHFHRECPYLIPAFFPQLEGQSNEEYYKMLGYQYSEDGKVEPQDKFLRRMSGVMRLYAAILVTPLKRSHAAEGKKHPLSMREAWRWFSASLNLTPRPDISPSLLFDFLEVAGRMFYKTYGFQFTKLLQILCADYFPLIKQVTPDGCGGPVVRLKSFLEKILKEEQVPPPTGLLPPNFW